MPSRQSSRSSARPRAPGLVRLVALAGLAAACGPAAPAVTTPAPAPTIAPAPEPPARVVRFEVAVDGKPAGSEIWTIHAMPDGSATYEFDSALETPRGKVAGQGRYAVTPSHLPDEAEVLVRSPREGSASFRLTRTGADLKMSMEHGSATDELKAGRPSNLFVPRPFFVGLAPVCALLEQKDRPPLVEFPGSAVDVVANKPLGAALVFTLDHAGLGRTLVACEGPDVVAVLDPWSGEEAVRSDRRDVGKALVASVERTKPATPSDLTEEEETVRVPAPMPRSMPAAPKVISTGTSLDDEAVLSCTFLRPAHPAGKLPAVVFATGSGPQDRDEDSIGRGGLKLSIFRVLANALAEKGIASLRCDDRGTGKSTGSFERATLETFVRDALATLVAVSKHKEVDPSRLGFVGHSEGAIVGMLVAAQMKTAAPAGWPGKLRALVLMSAPGRPLPEIGMMQEEAFLKKSGLPPEQVERQLAAQRAVMDAIRTGKPLPDEIPAAQKEIVEKQRGWLKSHFDTDVPATLAKVPKMAVLVAQGGKDIQVPPEDAERVRSALAAGKNPEAKVALYPGLNHVFAVSHGGGVTEYADVQAEVDAGFLADTTAFVAHALSP